jgi:tetratricopeptide (TPR) repeat protein
MLSASTLSGGDNALEGAFNLIGKLSAKNYTGSTSVAVAGVRGAEQGKKGSFGVQWQGTSQTKTSASATSASELEQARNLCSAQDFEGAISKLSAFISSSSDAQSKARANLLLSQANLELARSDKAIAAANAGLELSPNDSSVITQLNFALLSATWYTGKADATLAAIENYFPKTAGNASDEYWNAQVIKVLALKSTGNKMAAKKLKEELSSTCPNDEVVATLSQISF